MLPFVIYLVGTVEYIVNVCIFLTVVPGFLVTLSYILQFVLSNPDSSDFDKNWEEFKEKYMPWRKRLLKVFFVFLALATLLPNTKTVIAMYLVPKVVNNEKVQAIPDKALTLFNLKLDEWIQDVNKEMGVTNVVATATNAVTTVTK